MAYIRPLRSVTVFSPGIGNAFPGGTDKDVAGRPSQTRTLQTEIARNRISDKMRSLHTCPTDNVLRAFLQQPF